MDLPRLTAIVRSWLRLMIVAAVLAGLTAYVVSSLQRPVYEAKATLIVGQALTAANPTSNQFLVAENLATAYGAIAETNPVLQRVIDELGLDLTTREVADRVTVETPRDTALLVITAQSDDPARAAGIANTMATKLIASSPSVQGDATEFQQSIDADLEAVQALIQSTQARAGTLIEVENRTPEQEAELRGLEDRLASLRATYVGLLSYSSETGGNVLSMIEPAVTPTIPVAPTPLLSALLAAVLALLVVAGVAFLVEQLDDSIKDPDAVQEITKLNTLASVERMKTPRSGERIYSLAALLYPRSSAAESYRTLRSGIEFASVDSPLRTLLVTSTAPGEGKTVTAANLAVVFAQAGHRVLLVDADLRKPELHAMFRLPPNSSGLTTLLRSPSSSVTSVIQATEEPNLSVMTTGPIPPNPAELLGSNRMRSLVALLQREADVIIFDSPPVQAVTDAAVLSSFVDGTLLVVHADRSRRRAVRTATDTLAMARANVLGVVLNGVPAREKRDYAGYYESPAEADEATRRAPRPGVASEGAETSTSTSPTGS